MNNTDFYPAIRPKFLLALEILVGTTCILSILGASLIILTYVAYKDLRTTARQLLVNLSVADWIVAASHFVGIFHYKTFIPQYNRHYRSNTDTLCSVQGAFAMFSTVASFLWTISLAAYMFTIIVWRRPKLAKRLVVLFYLVCWGIPTILTIWFGFKKFFGFIETTDVGKPDHTECTSVLSLVLYRRALYPLGSLVPRPPHPFIRGFRLKGG